jgi:hypothetical protein
VCERECAPGELQSEPQREGHECEAREPQSEPQRGGRVSEPCEPQSEPQSETQREGHVSESREPQSETQRGGRVSEPREPQSESQRGGHVSESCEPQSEPQRGGCSVEQSQPPAVLLGVLPGAVSERATAPAAVATAEEPAAAQLPVRPSHVPRHYVQDWSTWEWLPWRLLQQRLAERRELQRAQEQRPRGTRVRGCRAGRRGRSRRTDANCFGARRESALSSEEQEAECEVIAVVVEEPSQPMGQELEDLGARGFFGDEDTFAEDLSAAADREFAEIDARERERVASERVLVRGAESDLHDDEFIWMV